jgi:hypothetical protein
MLVAAGHKRTATFEPLDDPLLDKVAERPVDSSLAYPERLVKISSGWNFRTYRMARTDMFPERLFDLNVLEFSAHRRIYPAEKLPQKTQRYISLMKNNIAYPTRFVKKNLWDIPSFSWHTLVRRFEIIPFLKTSYRLSSSIINVK